MMDIHQDKMKILVVIFSKNEKILHIKDNLQEILNYEVIFFYFLLCYISLFLCLCPLLGSVTYC